MTTEMYCLASGGGAQVKTEYKTSTNSADIGFKFKTLFIIAQITAFTEKTRSLAYDGEYWYTTSGNAYNRSQTMPSDLQITNNGTGFSFTYGATVDQFVYIATSE